MKIKFILALTVLISLIWACGDSRTDDQIEWEEQVKGKMNDVEQLRAGDSLDINKYSLFINDAYYVKFKMEESTGETTKYACIKSVGALPIVQYFYIITKGKIFYIWR